MSKWSDKIRRRREERNQTSRAQDQAERKKIEDAERRRRQEEMQRRVYDLQVQKHMEQKAQAEKDAEQAAIRSRQMLDAQRKRQKTYDEETDEY